MIEKIVFDYLSTKFSNVKMTIPKTQPSSFYLIEKTGSTWANHLTSSVIAIQSYAPTLYEAAEMNEALKDEMLYGLVAVDSVARVSLNSDGEYTDEETKTPRYQAVFVITHY